MIRLGIISITRGSCGSLVVLMADGLEYILEQDRSGCWTHPLWD